MNATSFVAIMLCSCLYDAKAMMGPMMQYDVYLCIQFNTSQMGNTSPIETCEQLRKYFLSKNCVIVPQEITWKYQDNSVIFTTLRFDIPKTDHTTLIADGQGTYKARVEEFLKTNGINFDKIFYTDKDGLGTPIPARFGMRTVVASIILGSVMGYLIHRQLSR